LRDPSANCSASCAGVKPWRTHLQPVRDHVLSVVAKKSQRKDPFSLFPIHNVKYQSLQQKLETSVSQTSLNRLNASSIQSAPPPANPARSV